MLITNVKQALLTAFNLSNQVQPAVTLDDVNWGPTEIWLQGDCNSRIKISGRAISDNFGGEQTIYFTRRHIALDLREVKIPGKSSDYTRLYQVLVALRTLLGVPVYESEFGDRAISGSTVTINVTPISMAYLPNGSITLEFAE